MMTCKLPVRPRKRTRRAQVADLMICVGGLNSDELGNIILSECFINALLQPIVVVDDHPNVWDNFSRELLE